MYCETDIHNYYTLNSTWTRKGIFGLQEIDEMLPFERLVYLDVQNAQIEKELEEIDRIKRGITS